MIQIKTNQLAPNRTLKNWIQKVLFSPYFRIIIAILFLFPVLQLNNLLTIYVLDKMDESGLTLFLKAIKTILSIILLIYSYSLYTKYIEKRSAFEFNLKKWYKDFGIGFGIGAGMVLLIVSILYIFGFYSVEHLNNFDILISRFFRYGQGSFIEELLFTIIIFRLLEEKLGSLVSFIIVSLFFGASHLMNDNATLFTSLCISIIQLSLLAPFILTRRIWMGWAVHFSWNFFQAGIFGMNNSGMNQNGFINPIISGPDWLTGGSFGIEASWLSLIVNLIVGISLLIYAVKLRQTVKFKPKR